MRSIAILFTIAFALETAPAQDAARWTETTLVGAGMPSFTYRVADYFPGTTFQTPVHAEAFTNAAGENRLLIASTQGQLLTVPDTPDAEVEPTVVFDYFAHLNQNNTSGTPPTEGRVLSTLFETDLAARPHLYLFTNSRKPHKPTNRILRYTITSLDPLTLDPEPLETITWESKGHTGGDLAWGPTDGMLYLTAGDRSSPGDPNNWGQRTDDIFGSILRIDVHGAAPYTIPADNPFIGKKNVRPEIWSYGLRNPGAFAFIRRTESSGSETMATRVGN